MADNSANTVTLTLGSYNTLKNESMRYSMMLASIMRAAQLSEDHNELVFNSDDVAKAIEFCFPENYKKKLSALKTQSTKRGNPT